MKLAFCIFKYFPFGGQQRDFIRIALLCRERGHSIHVYTTEWHGDIPSGFDVVVVPVRRCTNHRRFMSFVDQAVGFMCGESFDAVVGFNKMPGLDIYFAADPCYEARIGEKHGWMYRMTARYRCYAAMERAVFSPNAATRILILTEVEKERFIKYYGTPTERFHLLPPGISKDRVAPANAPEIRSIVRRELGVAESEYLLLMVGSGLKTKGVDRSIKALAALDPTILEKTRLFIVGQGNARPFERLAARLGVAGRVTFFGARDDVPGFLLAADLLLHPSYSETAGMVLVEAMASGLPVLATALCGYAFHVEKASAGLLAPSPFRQQELNRLLEYMLSSKERLDWSLNGMAYVAETDVFNLHEKAADFIESFPINRKGKNANV